jgi:hypothetical protein
MAVELRRRFLKPLRTAGIYLICATSGLAIAAASAGIYVRGTPRIPSMDTNWFGLSGAALVGVAFGFLLIVLRWFLGGLRYSGEGFVANRAIGAGLLTTKGTTTQLRRAG